MIEKVNPSHPDKLADRIAGAIVDLAYNEAENPKIAVEVLLGHNYCYIISESSVQLSYLDVESIVCRITGNHSIDIRFKNLPQDENLSKNQEEKIRCGDNGIFRGVPLTEEQRTLSTIAHLIYDDFPRDGKYILDKDSDKLIICQSNCDNLDNLELEQYAKNVIFNPLGYWTGGENVDCGATNRKLGSDMADSITGGGLHGKDLSKADVSVNIYAFLKAQETGEVVNICCAIGDTEVDGIPYKDIVNQARGYIRDIGGFEKFAEWGYY